MRAFLDTNVLLYAISLDTDEQHKRDRAREILDGRDLVLSVQVLQEFLTQATRPTRSKALLLNDAIEMIDGWRRRFPIQETTLALLDSGLAIQQRHRFSHWDSMIVAAARAQGCDVLWTEDMDDGRIIDGTRIVNPFKAH